MKIIDVSYWQPADIDWNQVKASGVEGVIARTGYGLNPDSKFDGHMQGALSVGLDVGAFHLIMSLDADGARAEANFAVSRCQQYPLTWPIYADFEDPDTMATDITSEAVAFCSRVEEFGYKGGIYGNLGAMRQFNWESIKQFSAWCAQYDWDYCSFENRVDMWQYQEAPEGTIPGISSKIDLNICYVDYRNGTVTPRPVPENAPISIPDAASIEPFTTLELQRTLNMLNFGELVEDDDFGDRSAEITGVAQELYGITVDRIPGPITWSKLSGQVTAVQIRLNELGYNVTVDGRLGRSGTETTSAVERYQEDHDLVADHIIGTLTFTSMFADQPVVTATPDPPSVIVVPSGGYDHHEQMTEHFNRWEFACECAFEGGPGYCDGFPADIHPVLVQKLEEVRLEVGFPLSISSGVRCPQLNADVGGVPDSYHMLGRCADVRVFTANGLSVSEFAQIARNHGLKTIEYPELSFVHCQWNN